MEEEKVVIKNKFEKQIIALEKIDKKLWGILKDPIYHKLIQLERQRKFLGELMFSSLINDFIDDYIEPFDMDLQKRIDVSIWAFETSKIYADICFNSTPISGIDF